mmetsp:Transcript_4054/g.9545  ORF Transcript_4054/g.9545 Transcript_4054/m.9545 type:complete len:460 (-) Transcript_4054:206-1585(-)
MKTGLIILEIIHRCTSHHLPLASDFVEHGLPSFVHVQNFLIHSDFFTEVERRAARWTIEVVPDLSLTNGLSGELKEWITKLQNARIVLSLLGCVVDSHAARVGNASVLKSVVVVIIHVEHFVRIFSKAQWDASFIWHLPRDSTWCIAPSQRESTSSHCDGCLIAAAIGHIAVEPTSKQNNMVYMLGTIDQRLEPDDVKRNVGGHAQLDQIFERDAQVDVFRGLRYRVAGHDQVDVSLCFLCHFIGKDILFPPTFAMCRIEAYRRPRAIVSMVRHGRIITPGSNDSMGWYDEITIESNGSVHWISGVEKSLRLKDDESVLHLRMQQRPVLTVVFGLGRRVLHSVGIGDGISGRLEQNDVAPLHPARLGKAKADPAGGPGGNGESNGRRIVVDGPVDGHSLALDVTGEECGVVKIAFSATRQPRHIRRIGVTKVLGWQDGGCRRAWENSECSADEVGDDEE